MTTSHVQTRTSVIRQLSLVAETGKRGREEREEREREKFLVVRPRTSDIGYFQKVGKS